MIVEISREFREQECLTWDQIYASCLSAQCFTAISNSILFSHSCYFFVNCEKSVLTIAQYAVMVLNGLLLHKCTLQNQKCALKPELKWVNAWNNTYLATALLLARILGSKNVLLKLIFEESTLEKI